MKGAGYGTEGEFPEIEYRQRVFERVMAMNEAIPGARFIPTRVHVWMVQVSYWIERKWREWRGE